MALRFFEQALRLARSRKLLSMEHLAVHSTLIEASAGLKSIRKKDGPPPKLSLGGPALTANR